MTAIANKPPSQTNKPERMRSDARRTRRGYMTLAVCKDVEIALFHTTMLGLEIAFNTVTEGRIPFRADMVTVVLIRKERAATPALVIADQMGENRLNLNWHNDQ